MIKEKDIRKGMWFTMNSYAKGCLINHVGRVVFLLTPFLKGLFHVEEIKGRNLICEEFTHIRNGSHPCVEVCIYSAMAGGDEVEMSEEDANSLMDISRKFSYGEYNNVEDSSFSWNLDTAKIAADFDKVFTEEFKIKYGLVERPNRIPKEDMISVGDEFVLLFNKKEGDTYVYGDPPTFAVYQKERSAPLVVVTEVDDDNVCFKLKSNDSIGAKYFKKHFLEIAKRYTPNGAAEGGLADSLRKERTEKQADDKYGCLFKDVTDKMNEMFNDKNHDYGNSFSSLFEECGMPYAYGHMKEKLAHIKSLMGDVAKVKGESMIDSLYDLANYAVLTIVELEKRNMER